MARKVYDPNESSQEHSSSGQPPDAGTVAQSQELYSNFLAEEISSQNIELPAGIIRSGLTSSQFQTLRQLANDFSTSPLREAVRLKAQQVDLNSLNAQNFMQMIQEVFQGGEVTKERVLVVFFFCSDLTVRALQQRANNCLQQIIQWSNDYVTGGMAAWVQQQGGWGVILNSSANTAFKISMTLTCCVAVLAMAVYIRKNWS